MQMAGMQKLSAEVRLLQGTWHAHLLENEPA